MTKEQFDLKYRGEKVAVHCDTEEKAKAFMSLAKSFGYTWCNGESLDNQSYIRNYGDKLCLTIESIFDKQGIAVAVLNYMKANNYKIVEFELDEPNGFAIEDTPSPMKETFKVGDVVYTTRGFKVKIVDTAWVVEFENDNGTFLKRNRELTHTKPLKKITEKELADMGYVLVK